MQSKNYVPGVSGWKLHTATGFLEVNGVMRMGGLLGADVKEPEPAPFIVVDGVTYIRRAEVGAGSVSQEKLDSNWQLKMSINSIGQVVASGVGIGLDSQFLVEADRFAVEQSQRDATKLLDDLAAQLSKTELGSELAEQLERFSSEEQLAEQVREVICKELRPGGLLHRR